MKIIPDPTGGAGVIVDTTEAAVPQHIEVAMLTTAAGIQMLGVELEGPILGQDLTSRCDQLFLMNGQQAAQLCTFVIGVIAQSGGPELVSRFYAQLDASLTTLRAVVEGGDPS